MRFPYLYIIFTLSFRIIFADYIPLHATTFTNLSRKQGSSQISIDLSPSQVNDFLVVGYFNLAVTSQPSSIIRLTPDEFDIYVLHLYADINSWVAKAKAISRTVNNYLNSISLNSASSPSATWKLYGIGYKSNNCYYLVHDFNSAKQMQYTQQCLTSSLFSAETVNLCIGCSVFGGNYSQMSGSYSNIKILTGFSIQQANTFYYNILNMSNGELKQSYTNNLTLKAFIDRYFSPSNLTCSSNYTFFDGICVIQSNCPLVSQQADELGATENTIYYDSSLPSCNVCQDNCSVCTSQLACTQCDNGFFLDPVKHQCFRCKSNYYSDPTSQTCVLTCPSGYYQDQANKMCVTSFDPYIHTIGPYFSKKQFQKNQDAQLIVTLTLATVPDSFELCIANQNSVSPYTFYGGANLLTTHSIKKSISNMPSNTYMRTVSFNAMSPGNVVNIILSVNSVVISSSKQSILSGVGLCADSTKMYTIVQFTFTLYDILPSYDIQISSSVDGWGVRDLVIKAYKCHPSCIQCYGKEAYQCWSCNKLVNKQQYQCFCQSGYYMKYKSNCYQNDCYTCEICPSNCLTCFDFTGKCISCASNYLLQGDQCILSSNCNGNWNSASNGLCIQFQKTIFKHFFSNKFDQYYEFWTPINSVTPSNYLCFSANWIPFSSDTLMKLAAYFPNWKSYNYQYKLSFTYSMKDSIDIDHDYLEVSGPGLSEKILKNWNSDGTNGFSDGCGLTLYKEKIEYFSRSKALSSSNLNLQMYSFTDDPFNLEGWIVKDIQLDFNYCHPTCTSCDGGSCSCIANAQNAGGTCTCNSYFYLAISPIDYRGICKPCNFACKTCQGQSYLDCITCREGYTKQNGVCVQNCFPGNYWDATLGSCQECSSCCLECRGPLAEDCFSCSYSKIMIWSQGKCYYKADGSQCTSCSNFSNGKCGGDGTLQNTNFCDQIEWFQTDITKCSICKTYFLQKCGGNSYNSYCTQNTIGYISSTQSSFCYPCSVAEQSNCGNVEIQSACRLAGWVFYQQSTCIQCGTYQDSKCSICYSSCQTCSGPSEIQCLTCKSGLLFFQGHCLTDCPNGYIKNSVAQSCDQCQFLSSVGCQKCFPTCKICSPFQISVNSNTCTSCYPSRILEKGRCNCIDPEDLRVSYFECSFQNQAVVDILLSNNSPIMTIEFGKILQGVAGHEGGNSIEICEAIFAQITLNLLGKTPLCTISGSKIIITIEEDAEVYDGDILTFLPNVLMFSSESVYINTFLNNKVFQQLPINVQIDFLYNKKTDSCIDFKIYLNNLSGDCQRRFKSLTWSLVNPNAANSEDIALQALFINASTNKLSSLIIPKGTVSIDVPKTIQLDFVMKNTYSRSFQFTFQFSRKSISLDVSKSQMTPFYRFNQLDLSLSWELKYCDANGTPTYYSANVNFAIDSTQMSALSISQNNYQSKNYIDSISPYTLSPSNTYNFKFKVLMSSDLNIYTEDNLELFVTPSPLIAKIQGGSKQMDYRTSKTFESYFRDRDLQDSTIDQQIIAQWTCFDPVTQSQCVSAAGFLVSFNSQPTATISAGTFNPYTFVVLHLTGSKDTRTTSTLCNVIFAEFDLPNLNLNLQMIDPEQLTLNLNEEVIVSLQYGGIVNTDILSFSGTVVYELNSVGVIKFDYITFRFKMWNIYSGFKRSNPLFSLRFSVYNPNYFMPSSQILQFKINFPPDQCQLHITQSDANAIALSTTFTLEMIGCTDEDIPIKYQFFYYSNYAEMEEEIANPSIVKRKQISDIQLESSIKSILPTGNLAILALSIDRKQAISNCTKMISVSQQSISEQQYSNLINSFLDTNNKTLSTYISQLSMASQDINSNPSFISSTIIQQKKVIISQLKSSIAQLPIASQFEDVANKAITSLIQSGVSFDSTEQNNQLNGMFQSLGQQLPSTFTSLKKEQRQQQLFDYYKSIDGIASNSDLNALSSTADLQMSLTERISNILNENSLPNENLISFSGNQIQITTQKITTKYLCSYYRCNSVDFQDTQSDNTASPSIYGISMVQYEKDPEFSDSSFQNYTSSLKNYTNETLTSYPFIYPKVKDANNGLVSINKDINVEFKLKGTKTNELSCLTQSSKSKWTQEGCKNVYSSKYQTFTCICSSANPTTIVDDLSALIINKNLQTAFSGQGLSNLSSWSNFYEFVAFWLILTETVTFILLLRQGNILDSFDMKHFKEISPSKVIPLNSKISILDKQEDKNSLKNNLQDEKLNKDNEVDQYDVNSKAQTANQDKLNEEQTSPFIQINFKNQILEKEIELPKKMDSPECTKLFIFNSRKSIRNNTAINSQVVALNIEQKLKEKTQRSEQGLESQSSEEECHNKNTKALSKSQEKENQEQSSQMFCSMKKKQMDDNEEKIFKKKEIQIKDTIDTISIQSKQKEKDKSSETQLKIDSNDYNQFRRVKFIKQIMLFHNFFNIFLIYDPKLSRQLRFSIFYVRLIHSLAVSVVYASQYTQAEMIAVSIFNAIIVTIVLKLLEFLTNYKTIGKKLASVFLSILLLFYYYLILSIVSGQDSTESNKSIGSFFIVFVTDLFITATATAFAFKFLAEKVLKKAGQMKFSQQIITFLKLQMILEIIDRL